MDLWLELGLFALLVAATAVGFTCAIRQAPVIRGWNERGVKPWACDLCMSFWVTLTWCSVSVIAEQDLVMFWAWMPAFALAYSWLTRVTPMPEDSFDPGLPEPPADASGDPE